MFKITKKLDVKSKRAQNMVMVKNSSNKGTIHLCQNFDFVAAVALNRYGDKTIYYVVAACLLRRHSPWTSFSSSSIKYSTTVIFTRTCSVAIT